jgi:hypothetical protein
MRPRLIHALDGTAVAEILDRVWTHAPPGREAAERNAVLRALLIIDAPQPIPDPLSLKTIAYTVQKTAFQSRRLPSGPE